MFRKRMQKLQRKMRLLKIKLLRTMPKRRMSEQTSYLKMHRLLLRFLTAALRTMRRIRTSRAVMVRSRKTIVNKRRIAKIRRKKIRKRKTKKRKIKIIRNKRIKIKTKKIKKKRIKIIRTRKRRVQTVVKRKKIRRNEMQTGLLIRRKNRIKKRKMITIR